MSLHNRPTYRHTYRGAFQASHTVSTGKLSSAEGTTLINKLAGAWASSCQQKPIVWVPVAIYCHECDHVEFDSMLTIETVNCTKCGAPVEPEVNSSDHE